MKETEPSGLVTVTTVVPPLYDLISLDHKFLYMINYLLATVEATADAKRSSAAAVETNRGFTCPSIDAHRDCNYILGNGGDWNEC